MFEPTQTADPLDGNCPAFDLLRIFDSIVLPSAVLSHMDLNTRKLLRLCCKRLRSDVDAHLTSITINRYNIAKLQPTVPGSLALRYPRLRRLAFGANEPRDVAKLLRAQLPALASSLECLDFWSYYASISTDLWAALVELAPTALRLRLNINESLLRRMEVAAVLAALSTLRAGRPGLVMEFNTGHTSFGFRSTEPETLQFLSSVDYVRSVGFSIGLHGRELQDEHFFGYIAIAGAASAMVTAPSLRQPSPAATSIEALSLTHYEAAERPPVGPLLHGIHLLAALRDLTLDCEITLLELAPLAACSFLTKLTIDLLTVRPQAPAPDPPPADWNPGPAIDADGGGGVAGGLGVVNGGFGGGPWSAEAAAAAAALPQVRSLTLGSESHPAQLLAEVFPGLTELICVPCTRTVGVYNTFHCGLMLGGATCLTRLMLNCVVAAEAPAILAYATALTALAFTHANNVSTAGLLCAAAELPQLRRLALWDHEEADEYLAIRGILTQPQLQVYQQPQPQLPPEAAAVGGSALLFPHLEELEVRATSPEFFDEIVALLAMGTLQFVIRQDPVGCYGPGGGGSGGGGCGAIGGGEGGNSGGVRRARLDACFDPPLLRVGQLRELLAALGPCLRHAVVSGWATPGSEAALLQLGRDIGRPELVMGYEYPIL